MCVNSERKGRWYVEKTGAKVLELNIDGTLGAIQLTFLPKGTGYNESDVFGLTEQETRCVVSGTSDLNILTRHHIVPTCYRKHLPEAYKSKNHHDVVFLTEKIHDDYERIAVPFRDEVHKRYGIPTEYEILAEHRTALKEAYSHEVEPLRIAAHALLQGRILSSEKKIQHEITVIMYVDKLFNEKINVVNRYWLEKVLEYIYKRKEEIKEDLHVDPFKVLVDKLTDYDEFIKMWRTHFIETMNPPYMPIGWSIDGKCKVEFTR